MKMNKEKMNKKVNNKRLIDIFYIPVKKKIQIIRVKLKNCHLFIDFKI